MYVEDRKALFLATGNLKDTASFAEADITETAMDSVHCNL